MVSLRFVLFLLFSGFWALERRYGHDWGLYRGFLLESG
jgi:hypothetical protein